MLWCGILAIVLQAADTPILIINEDNSHFFGSRSADEMSIEGLNAFVDQYANTKVTHLFLCPSAMRASYASDVWDRIWDLGDQEVPEGNEFSQKWVDNARLLHERGLDCYAVWIARCREKGISPWLSMRMNDVHDVDNPKNFMHNTFWVMHPEYWRVPGSTGAWVDRAYNYAIPEVREHHMALVRELLERYDADGLELDWMRFGYHFAPGKEAEGAVILTDFMRDVRQLANSWAEKRGHPIQICARVPAHPDAAIGLGMDGITWAKEGLIDMLVPTPFWATADFDIPVELWREQLGDADAKVIVAPGQEVLLRAFPGAEAVLNDLASTRGFAAAAWHRGAEAIYTFNYMDPASILGGPAAYRQFVEEGLARDVVLAKPRRHVVTYRDTVPAGVSNGVQLPASTDAPREFRLYVGPVAGSGDAEILIGLGPQEGLADVALNASLNGAACTPLVGDWDLSRHAGADQLRGFAATPPALQEGYNTIRVEPAAGNTTTAQIVWVEISFGARETDL